MGFINRIVDALVRLSALIACACMVGMMLLIAVEVVIRPMGTSMLMTDEYSGYMVLAVLGFGLPLAFERNAMLRVEFIFDRLGKPARRALTLIYSILILGFCALVTYRLGLFAIATFGRGTISPTPMGTPLYLPQALVPLGLLLVCIVALRRLFRPLRDDVHSPVDQMSD